MCFGNPVRIHTDIWYFVSIRTFRLQGKNVCDGLFIRYTNICTNINKNKNLLLTTNTPIILEKGPEDRGVQYQELAVGRRAAKTRPPQISNNLGRYQNPL